MNLFNMYLPLQKEVWNVTEHLTKYPCTSVLLAGSLNVDSSVAISQKIRKQPSSRLLPFGLVEASVLLRIQTKGCT